MNYLNNRQLDKNKFWYCNNFIGLISELNNKTISTKYDPRLVIPYINNNTKELYTISGRTLNNNSVKYLNHVFNEDYGKIYNYFNIDKNKRVYVLEGPIDSMFIENSIALSQAAITDELLKKFSDFKEIVFIFDNDFVYNIEIRNIMKKVINKGYKIFISPKELLKYKDINSMICSGIINIKEIIDNNLYSGILANIKLSQFPIIKES